ncbi:hypothetical protein [Streptomyces sp. CBMA123]|uniref:hypothetical protein n=1 Tax=Streptomyces sp. CBMA123 TaxID=1896313 RepID=UPI0016621969|nr:hypothetical protein [Streptomyces sp. CBMA123]
MIRSTAQPQDALAAAACQLADAASFLAEAAVRRPSADRATQRELLSEALSCTRAAGTVMRFAVMRANDQVRSAGALATTSVVTPRPADAPGPEDE